MGDYTDGYGGRTPESYIWCRKCQRHVIESKYYAYHKEHDNEVRDDANST